MAKKKRRGSQSQSQSQRHSQPTSPRDMATQTQPATQIQTQTPPTLPLHTVPVTLSLPHHMHHDTQILIHGGTLTALNDVEGASGDTQLLQDDDGGHNIQDDGRSPFINTVQDAAFDDVNRRSQTVGSKVQDAALDDVDRRTSENAISNGQDAALNGVNGRTSQNAVSDHAAPTLTDAAESQKTGGIEDANVNDSDATTQEGNGPENAEDLETCAESRRVEEDIRQHEGTHLEKSSEQGVEHKTSIHEYKDSSLQACQSGTLGKHHHMDTSKCIGSVHADSMHASGLKSAAQNLLTSSDGTDTVGKLDFECNKRTPEIAGGMNDKGGSQAVLTGHAVNDDSPPLSSSKVSSKSLASIRASALRASGIHAAAKKQSYGKRALSYEDSEATIDLNLDTIDAPHIEVLDELKNGGMKNVPESTSNSLRKLDSQISVPDEKGQDGNAAALDAEIKGKGMWSSENSEIKRYTRHSQKMRNSSGAINAVTDTPLCSKLDTQKSGEGTVISEQTKTKTSSNTLQENQHVIPSLQGDRSCNLKHQLSYLESHEPGEETQLDALNVIDKLVWLNATDLSQDTEKISAPQEPTITGHQGAKGFQSLARTAEMKTIQDKIDVYDWVDSQIAESGHPSEMKEAPTLPSSTKKKAGASKAAKTKKTKSDLQEEVLSLPRTGNRQKKITESKSTVVNPIDQADTVRKKPSLDSEQDVAPHSLLTSRLRNRSRQGPGYIEKKERISSVKAAPHKNIRKRSFSEEAIRHVKHQVDSDVRDSEKVKKEKQKHQCVDEISEADLPKAERIGDDTQTALDAINILRSGSVIGDGDDKGCVVAEPRQEDLDKKQNANEVNMKPMDKGSSSKEIKRTKWAVVQEDPAPEAKRRKLRSNMTKSAVRQPDRNKQGALGQDSGGYQKGIMKKGTPELDILDVKCKSKNDGSDAGRLHLENNGASDHVEKRKVGNRMITRRSRGDISTETVKQQQDNLATEDASEGTKLNQKHTPQHEMPSNVGQKGGLNEMTKGLDAASNSSPAAFTNRREGSHKTNRKRKARFPDTGEDGDTHAEVPFSNTRESGSALREGRASKKFTRTRGHSQAQVSLDGNVPVVQGSKPKEEAKNDGKDDQTYSDKDKNVADLSQKKATRQKKGHDSLEIQTKTECSPVVRESRRNKRDAGSIWVLFSHSLPKETKKHQLKLLDKLGGSIAKSAADCSHFVANCFIRTRNMLESIAAGKPVVTPLWLESCAQAHYFVDEKNYLLQDEKKERELGFSMHSSLAAARRRPLLKDISIILSPNTTPDSNSITAIIRSAGGQVVQSVPKFVRLDSTGNAIVIATEKDLDFCRPLLKRGFKAYSSELILNGIVVQSLDFSRNRLFEEAEQNIT